jgi:hypothetical protein
VRVIVFAAAGAAVWLAVKVSPDPRKWPAYLTEEWARVRRQGQEALAAGKRAATRREEELDRELEAAGFARPRVNGGAPD